MSGNKAKSKPTGLPIIHERAAGIDIGSRFHVVAVSPDLSAEPLRTFQAFTSDLQRMADWLIKTGIKTVAMESTGVYWVAAYEVLESRGIDVILANAREARAVPGRKSDVNDAQWLQRLHACGLLRASFRPGRDIAALRVYLRSRERHLDYAAAHIQHMQKALTFMNLQLHHVISDITGATGMKIIRAIVAGERDPGILAALRDTRCKTSVETVRAALEGNYQPEHLFALKQALALYDFYQRCVAECDAQIEQVVAVLNAERQTPEAPLPKPRHRTKQPNDVNFDVRTARHFTSWLTLSPGCKISGSKVLSAHTRKTSNRVTAALRLAAVTVGRTNTALGAFYRRLAARIGNAKAVTTTARKIAVLFYNAMRFGMDYKDPGADHYEQQYRDRVLKQLHRRAAQFGLILQPQDTSVVECVS